MTARARAAAAAEAWHARAAAARYERTAAGYETAARTAPLRAVLAYKRAAEQDRERAAWWLRRAERIERAHGLEPGTDPLELVPVAISTGWTMGGGSC